MELFENISGYEDIKKELNTIRGWYQDQGILNNEKIKLPKGIIFYGRYGNGKTLFVREFAKSFNVPVFNIDGKDDCEDENMEKRLSNIFKEAYEQPFSIIILDELDKIISSANAERILQINMDGFVEQGRVIVLATTNNLHSIDRAILRTGRFDRKIYISAPAKESREQILKQYVSKLENDVELDFDYLAHITDGLSCADISGVINEAYLRGNGHLTVDGIEQAVEIVAEGGVSNSDLSTIEKNPKTLEEIAYHETGHAMICYKNRRYFDFYKAKLGGSGGYIKKFSSSTINSIPSQLAELEIALAGYAVAIARKADIDSGSAGDALHALELATNLVNERCLFGPSKTLALYEDYSRMETDVRKHRNEKYIEKLINKTLKKDVKFLKKNKHKLDKLAKIFIEKKGYGADTLKSVMEE